MTDRSVRAVTAGRTRIRFFASRYIDSAAAMRSVAAPYDLRPFQSGAVDPARFPHAEHVRVGYEMLSRYSFGDAISRFSRGLKLLAAKAGKPKANQVLNRR